jgi:hypothetical protein
VEQVETRVWNQVNADVAFAVGTQVWSQVLVHVGQQLKSQLKSQGNKEKK